MATEYRSVAAWVEWEETMKYKEQEGILGSNRNILCRDCDGGGYMTVYIFLNSSHCTLKIALFYCI